MIRIIIFLSIATIAFGCKKNKDLQNVAPVFKPYFSFQPGTYWIYKDSLTGKEDSFYVTQNTTTIKYGEQYNESSINIHNDTTACSYILNGSGFVIKFTKPDDGRGTSLSTGTYWSEVTTFSVGGNMYDSVYYGKKIYDFYFHIRHNIGMLKMAVNKGTYHKVWELQRYYIVK